MPRVVSNPRNIQVKVVLTKEEFNTLKRESFLKGQSQSEYIRRAVFPENYKKIKTPASGE